MKKLIRTKKEAWKACQALWKELAETGKVFKEHTQAFKLYNIDKDKNKCPLCTYTFEIAGHVDGENTRICNKYCPKTWPDGTCYQGTALFHNWLEVKTREERKSAALAIYNLPIRKNSKI